MIKPKINNQQRQFDYIQKDPHQVIHDVWRNFDLDYAIDNLEYWFYMAMAEGNGSYDDGEDRAELVGFYFDLLHFVEALYFYNKPRDTGRIEFYNRSSQELKDIFDSENQGKRLTDEGKSNPEPIIVEFCQAFPIEYARTVLWQFFEAVCHYEGEFKEYINPLGLHHFYSNLAILVEAAHVIFKKGNA